MYAVIKDGVTIGHVKELHYIRQKPSTGAFLKAEEATSQGIVVAGVPYTLSGKPKMQGTETVIIVEVDEGEHFDRAAKSTDERFRETEDALIELAEMITGGE